MRWLIAAVAFLAPVLIAVTILMSGHGDLPAPAIGGEGLGELRSWLNGKREILDHYAPKPGDGESDGMPHAALDRFDRSGCDRLGNPWFRLADRPPGIECGVLRRTAADRPVSPAGHRTGLLLLRVSGDWLYWEWRQPAVETGSPRRSGP